MNDGARDKSRWLALAVLLVASFQAVLTSTIVIVAVPAIRSDLQLTAAAAAWVLGAYALCYGVLLVPGGRLGDLFGRRSMFLIGTATFTFGALVAATATQSWMLILGTAIQGCGAGLTVPQVLGSIPSLFDADERGRAFGMYGVAAGLGAAIGPLAGGGLVAIDFLSWSWRSVFAINVPLGVVALVLGWRVLPRTPRSPGSIDVFGTVLLAGGLTLILLPVTASLDAGWSTDEIAVVCSAVLPLGAFLWLQRRLAARGKVPLLHLTLFMRRSFVAALVIGLSYFTAFQAMQFTIAVYLQDGVGYSAAQAGLCLTSFAIASVLTSMVSDRLTRAVGRYSVVIGVLFVIGGLAATAVMVATDLATPVLAAGVAVVGVGHGLIVPPNVTFGLRDVPASDSGGASGAIVTAQRLGQTVGVAVIGGAYLSTSLAAGYQPALVDSLVIQAGVAAVALIAARFLPRWTTS